MEKNMSLYKLVKLNTAHSLLTDPLITCLTFSRFLAITLTNID